MRSQKSDIYSWIISDEISWDVTYTSFISLKTRNKLFQFRNIGGQEAVLYITCFVI